jgi:hypothetical protein
MVRTSEKKHALFLSPIAACNPRPSCAPWTVGTWVVWGWMCTGWSQPTQQVGRQVGTSRAENQRRTKECGG